ncbi:MAG: chorismate lyase [endosymbiont of Galathealinum brachiosum]|uniref:Probable chorismate pyruvate-lyase n=1 Tax=endosymbiont of Galathealinum brachiosum TaxID=2200906 RepID=A0A370DDV5_9GAMM|nr:MAG: chorismate lyase [endosymbiont of Galathealinum brachiosum]
MSGHHTRLRWCNQKSCFSTELNAEIKSWLFDSGSLTARLLKHCSGTFSVKVLSVKRATPTPDEIKALKLKVRSQAIIRQVLLLCDGQPVVYARTIIPVSSLRGSLRGIVLLGNRSLGAVLFSDKNMQRKPMEITSLKVTHKFHAWTGCSSKEAIWGRRSIFILKNQELLVSEFFLPELLN